MKKITPPVAAAMAHYRPLLQRYARRLLRDEVSAAKIVEQVLEDELLLNEISPAEARAVLRANLIARCHCFVQFNLFNRPPVKVPVRKNINPLAVIGKAAKSFLKLSFL